MKLIFIITLSVLVVFQCNTDKKVKLLNYKTEDCNSDESFIGDVHTRNRIKKISFQGDTLSLEIFFIESCGFVINPSIEFELNTLLINVDQYILDSNRVYALCLCCYNLELQISGLKNIDRNNIDYRLHLDSYYPEKIYLTDSLYHTYNLNFSIVEEDTIYYPKQNKPYMKRIFSNELEESSSYVLSYFPDKSDIFYKKFYEDGTELLIENGYFEKQDSLNNKIELGTVEYHFLDNNKGVRVLLEK